MLYEYTTKMWDGYMDTTMQDTINEMADEGWRLFGITGDYLKILVFEREARPEQNPRPDPPEGDDHVK